MEPKGRAPDLTVPPFVTVTFVGEATGAGPYAISNEASGKHFAANEATVAFLEALRRTGSLTQAAAAAKTSPEQGQALLSQMMRFGVVVDRGRTNSDATPKAQPLEARAIMIRFDLIDATRWTHAARYLGRMMYSRAGLLIWSLVGIAALFALAENGDKAAASLAALRHIGPLDVALFTVIFIALKIAHEAGHALAYQEMCRRAGIAPGPIRMGISIFAFSPFPFTDVSGAWRLKGRLPRVIIGAGGLYFEFFVVALLVLLWAGTTLGPLQQAIFQVAAFSALSSLLFNLNPAVKLDGYYIFSDLFGQANLAGRASMAARFAFARACGAEVARPERGALAYWGVSYLYRWTIFAGIFWMAYLVDPRLGAPVFAITCLMLVVRPLMGSLAFARDKGARPMRLAALGVAALAILGASAIPFRDRVLLEGSLEAVELTFLRVEEPAKLTLSESGSPTLESPELAFQIEDLKLRGALLATTLRSVNGSAAERARLENDLRQIGDLQAGYEARLAGLSLDAGQMAAWTPIAADKLQDAWVQPHGSEALGALAEPVQPRLALWMDQRDFAPGLLAADAPEIAVRLGHNPDCAFTARLQTKTSGLSLGADGLRLTADIPQELPLCAQGLPHGSAVVARLPAPPASMLQRGWHLISGLLQDRLPIERLTEGA